MKEFEVTPKDTEVVIRQLPTSRLEAMGCSDIPKGRMHIVVLEQDSEKNVLWVEIMEGADMTRMMGDEEYCNQVKNEGIEKNASRNEKNS